MNNISIAIALATSPSKAFEEIRERPRFWFPLLLVIIATAGMMGWYYSVVDIDWLKELMFANNADFQKMPAEQRAGAMAFVGRNTMLIGSVIGVCVMIPVFYLLNTVYFLLAGKVTKLTPGFKQWFALTCWTALPVLINVVISTLLLLIRDNDQIGPGILQPLSLNELLLHYPFGSKPQGFFEALSIPTLLSWALLIMGVRAWSQRSWVFSTIFAMIPALLIFGIWSIFVFR
jgi:Yip1 domain